MSDSPAVASLRIQHIPEIEPAAFQVVRLSDVKIAPAGEVPSPVTFPVGGRKDGLLAELQWYLERFLEYPFSPETEHAERILVALEDWGEQTFRALFTNPAAVEFFAGSTGTAYSNLHLQVASDDPKILGWPWEALRDPRLGWLAQTCQVERRLNKGYDPQPISESLPKDRVNILLVVARPYGEKDVRFRSIARPLVELVEKESLPASVELLRPPTFDGLREHFRKRPGYYHILHFDGHGAYSDKASAASGFTMQGPAGMLIFEDAEGGPDPIAAEKLSALLREHALPGVVLNACQSAMIDAGAQDPFASVATALLRSGMRDVVAMAYTLYVSGAQHFLPAFYRGLFEEGSMAKAVRLGRQQMWTHEGRVCARGTFPLQDWLLPVLYRQEPLDFSFAASDEAAHKARESKLPEDLRLDREPYGFIGRDSAILALERAMRRNTPAVLIQGLGGVGKTTLAKGFLQWLDATGGLEFPPFWFPFQEIRSAEFVFNRMGEALFGPQFGSLTLDQKTSELSKVFRQHRKLIVWDNFESAAGIEGTAVSANMPREDRTLLAGFLDGLRGGKTKVVITSRSTEDWLGPQRRFLLPLGGMDDEERWEYCDAVLRDLGLRINREDSKLIELMNQLGGHPLAMRAILPRLEKMTASRVVAALRRNLADLGAQSDEALARVYATLGFVQQSLPVELQGLLVPLGLYENCVDADYLERMAKEADPACTRAQIDSLMQALAVAGLLRDVGQSMFEMHPLLTSYLRSSAVAQAAAEIRERWTRAFVDVMGSLADALSPRDPHKQRGVFHLHGQNFYFALEQAERVGLSTAIGALTESMADFALESRNFADATWLYVRLAKNGSQIGDLEVEANAYHQLGIVFHYQRDFQTAEQWYRKSLEIKERTGNQEGIARAYHQLGILAEERRDFVAAREWYGKSLEINEKLENEKDLAATYHQLGWVAQLLDDPAEAERWYLKSLEISRRLGHDSGSAMSLAQLGSLARNRKDYKTAWGYTLETAEIFERLHDEPNTATAYTKLGLIAAETRDLEAAEGLYRISLAISEKLKDAYGSAFVYGNLGNLESERGNYLESGRWLIKCIGAFQSTNNPARAEKNSGNFLLNYQKASSEEQRQLRAMWEKAGLGPLPEDAGQQ
jgi:tetratricopeptide (TPR) repeat protein